MTKNPEIVRIKADFIASEKGVEELLKAWRTFLEDTEHILRGGAEFTVEPPTKYL